MTLTQTKHEVVKTILTELGFTPHEEVIDQAVGTWFLTKRSGNNYGLTRIGYENFIAAGIQQYSISFTQKNITDLTFYLKNVIYYICYKDSLIYFFDSKLAFFISLYGDVESYLKTLRQNDK